MPYLKPPRRKRFDSWLENIIPLLKTKGDLNYCFYRLALEWLFQNNGNDISYQRISDAIAAMNDCAEEFRRQILNPYEDLKINDNGDIKPFFMEK